MEQDFLDIYSLRQVLKKSFTKHIVNLENAIQDILAAAITNEEAKKHLKLAPKVEEFVFNDFGRENKTEDVDEELFDGFINWDMLLESGQSFNSFKQSLTVALDRMEIHKAVMLRL